VEIEDTASYRKRDRPVTFEYRLLAPEDDHAFQQVVGRTFRFDPGYWEIFKQRIGRENLRSVHDAGGLIGGLGFYRTAQWFGGRAIPCAAVAAVGIAPASRGSGAAAFLMTSLLQELHAEGVPLATLYASTQRLYRKVGFEQAGSRVCYQLPMTSIGHRDRELPVSEVSLDSAEPFEPLAQRQAQAASGHLQRTSGLWERLLTHRDGHQAGFVIGAKDRPEGYLICRHHVDKGEASELIVRDMAALTPAAARRVWTLLADHRSIIPSVRWCGPSVEPLLCLTDHCRHVPSTTLRWLTRIVDVPKALASRGYPHDVSGEVHLEIRDDLLPANHGRFLLRVDEGRAEVTAGGRGSLVTDIRGLTPLYTGFLPPQTLQSLGCLQGSGPALRQATILFSGPEPWMVDYF
jgi:predicted acetyltransferase